MLSAARPFTNRLVLDLVSAGVAIAPITLHTGVSSPETGEPPSPERFAVPEATARLVNDTKTAGGRIVAVAGEPTVHEAYVAAMDTGYLWHEFGDSSLLFRAS
jgi:S-adenosylmethionine:tRNA ribosyltransferase-isomerase